MLQFFGIQNLGNLIRITIARFVPAPVFLFICMCPRLCVDRSIMQNYSVKFTGYSVYNKSLPILFSELNIRKFPICIK